MIELNEWDISTSFNNGFISQYLTVYNGSDTIGTYYAEPSNNIESAIISRDNLLKYIENDLSNRFVIKINRFK